MTRTARFGWWRAIALGAIALACASCNLPTNSAAIQFTGSPTSNSGCGGQVDVAIYLTKLVGPTNHQLGQLVRVSRSTKQGNVALCTLQQLNLGPNEVEYTEGIATALPLIPEGLDLVGQNGPVATVALDQAFLAIEPQQNEVLALGQIVYTMTAVPGIAKVQFDFNGRPYRAVVFPGGRIDRSGLATQADYCSIGPPPGCSSVTTRKKSGRGKSASGR